MDNQRGFTLVEAVMVSFICLIVGGLLLIIGSVGFQVWARTDTRLSALSDAQRALDRVSEQLMKASQQGLSCAGGGLTMTRKSDNGILNYQLSNGQLVLTENGAPNVVAAGLLGFSAVCQPEGLVRLEITTRSSSGGFSGSPQVLQSQVWVRNP